MRLIDADELIKHFREKAEDAEKEYEDCFEDSLRGYAEAMYDAVNAIKTAPTIPQWHRCEDEMPSESGFYLVYDGTHFPVYLNYTKRKGKFDYSFSIDEPMFWMPLPELPKEAEE